MRSTVFPIFIFQIESSKYLGLCILSNFKVPSCRLSICCNTGCFQFVILSFAQCLKFDTNSAVQFQLLKYQVQLTSATWRGNWASVNLKYAEHIVNLNSWNCATIEKLNKWSSNQIQCINVWTFEFPLVGLLKRVKFWHVCEFSSLYFLTDEGNTSL